MAILKIARMGHPVLLREAEPVSDPTAPEIRRLVDVVVTNDDLHAAQPPVAVSETGTTAPKGRRRGAGAPRAMPPGAEN